MEFGGKYYVAQWWTSNSQPGQDWGDWQFFGNSCNHQDEEEDEQEEDEGTADVVDIALGGGEAPACRAEVASASLSTNTSPESEDANSDFCPVFPSTSSKTQSLPRGSGRVSALVGAMIASSKEFVPPDKIEEEEAASGCWW